MALSVEGGEKRMPTALILLLPGTSFRKSAEKVAIVAVSLTTPLQTSL